MRRPGIAPTISSSASRAVELRARCSGSLRTASSTFGSICAKRSITLRAPKSGEQRDQTAPSDAHARNAAAVSGMFGM